MELKFRNFWPGFEEEKEVFENLLKIEALTDEIETVEFHSVFLSIVDKYLRFISSRVPFSSFQAPAKTKKNRPKNHKKIWYTGENIRPPFRQDFDLTLSFDQDTFSGTNVYLPLLYLRLLFQTESNVINLGKEFNLATLVEPRSSDLASRKKFACAFINNAEPTRMRAIEALRSIGDVDTYGKLGKFRVESKFPVARDYLFMVCFENGLYPGYVTEKILDAYICGTVPIYWGDLGQNSILNPDAFINYKDFSTLEELVGFISNLSPNDLKAIVEAPLLRRLPSLREVQSQIRDSLLS